VLHVNSEVLVHFKNIESPACNIVSGHLTSHFLRAHVDLFLELNLLRSTLVHNNAIQRAAPSSPPKNAILFVVSPAKTCMYSSSSCYYLHSQIDADKDSVF
jgi:hypothetical protein